MLHLDKNISKGQFEHFKILSTFEKEIGHTEIKIIIIKCCTIVQKLSFYCCIRL